MCVCVCARERERDREREIEADEGVLLRGDALPGVPAFVCVRARARVGAILSLCIARTRTHSCAGRRVRLCARACVRVRASRTAPTALLLSEGTRLRSPRLTAVCT